MKNNQPRHRFALPLTCLLTLTASAHADEATQWRSEEGGNGHWYEIRLLQEQISWPAARSEAESLGGYLVTLTSEAENDFLWDAFVHDQQYWIYETHGSGTQVSHGPWIGGFQTCNSCSYQWVTGEAWNYANWAAGEPYNHPNENYINFWQRSGHAPANQWNDAVCCSIALVVEYDADCNGDGIVDYGQILDGTFADDDGNGVPDCCDDGSICGCPADLNQDRIVNGGDLSILLGWWGIDSETSELPDLTADGRVNGEDLTVLLGSWGPCR